MSANVTNSLIYSMLYVGLCVGFNIHTFVKTTRYPNNMFIVNIFKNYFSLCY